MKRSFKCLSVIEILNRNSINSHKSQLAKLNAERRTSFYKHFIEFYRKSNRFITNEPSENATCSVIQTLTYQ